MACPLAEILHEDAHVAALAQLGDAFLAYLSHALACEAELGGYLLKSHLVASYAEALAYDGCLAVVEHALEHGVELLRHALVVHHLVGAAVVAAGHDVEHGVLLTVLEGRVNAHVVAVGHHALLYLVGVHVRGVGDLLDAWLALVLLLKAVDLVVDLAERPHLVQRQPYDAALLGDGLQDALPDPPHGVGDELEAACLIEFLGSLDQADVALVDEVGQRQALVLVLLGHGDHKAQVGGYEPLLCPFALASSFLDLLCQRYLLIDGDEWGPAYFHQILV